MFEELLFIVGFGIFSALGSYLLLKYTSRPVYKILKILGLVGIVIHEICHVVMCVLINTRIKEITLLSKGESKYFGRVVLSDKLKISFMQSLLVSFAPLIFSFWLFFLLLEQVLMFELHPLLFYLYIFLMVSLFLGAAPSIGDITSIPKAFKAYPRYSLYQIFLAVLSIVVVWIVAIFYELSFFHEIVYYVLIAIFYYGFKYTFRGINELYHRLSMRKIPYFNKHLNSKSFSRNRPKPTRPSKLGIEEAHW